MYPTLEIQVEGKEPLTVETLPVDFMMYEELQRQQTGKRARPPAHDRLLLHRRQRTREPETGQRVGPRYSMQSRHRAGVAGPYPAGSHSRLIIRLAIRLGRPIDEIARLSPRQIVTILEELEHGS